MRIVKQIWGYVLFTVIILLIIPFLPILVVQMIFQHLFWKQKEKRMARALEAYIQQNEGKRFFFYTRRKKLEDALDNIVIPNLPADVQPVDIGDKSGVLIWLAHTGPNTPVPFILTITNGEVHKRSINSQLYHAIAHGKDVREVKVV